MSLKGKNLRQRLNTFQAWMTAENQGKIRVGKDGIECDGRIVHVIVIRASDKLRLPPSPMDFGDYNPIQHKEDCRAPAPVTATEVPQKTPNLSITIPEEQKPEPVTPVYFAKKSGSATNGKYWTPETLNWAYEFRASSGVDEKFTRKYYREELTPRLPEVHERYTGDTDDFTRSGKYPGSNRLSRKDNDQQRRDNANGATTAAGRVLSGDRGHVFVGGFIDEVLPEDKTLADGSVIPKGSMTRHNHMETTTYFNWNTAMTLRPFKLVIPIGPGGGIATSNPTTQRNLATVTGVGGLTEVNHAFSELNKIGKSGFFTDEQTVNSNSMTDGERIVWATVLDNSTKIVSDRMQTLTNGIGSPEEKRKAAIEILTGIRDQQDNPLVKQVGPYTVQLKQLESATRDFLTNEKIEIPSRQELADTNKYPELAVHYMDENLLHSLHDYHFNHQKYAIIKQHLKDNPNGVHPGWEAAKGQTYGVEQNKYELHIATARDRVATQAEMMPMARDAWQAILAKPAAVNEFADFVAKDYNAQVSFGAWLHDIDRNPKNYGMTKAEANETLRTMLGKDKASIHDVGQKGNSSPVIFFRDQPFALARPEDFGPVAAAAIKANPEMFQKAIEASIKEDAGKTDGNRHAIGMLGAYGRNRLHKRDGATNGMEPVPVTKLKAAVADKADLVDNAIFNAVYYGDNAVANTSVQGREWLQNEFQKAQNDRMAGKPVDATALYNHLFTSPEAHAVGADKVGVAGIFGTEPAVAQDATFLSLMRNPDKFGSVIGAMHDYGNSTNGGKNNNVRRMLQKVQTMATAYNAMTPDERASDQGRALWKAAAETYEAPFVSMHAKADAHHMRKAKIYANALDGMFYAVGQDADLSKATLQTMLDDQRLMHAGLTATPNATAYTDGVDHTHLSGANLLSIDNSIYNTSLHQNGDKNSLLYATMPTNKHGKVKVHKGFLGLGGRRDLQVQGDPLVAPLASGGQPLVDGQQQSAGTGQQTATDQKQVGDATSQTGAETAQKNLGDGNQTQAGTGTSHKKHQSSQSVAGHNLTVTPEMQQQLDALRQQHNLSLIDNDLHVNTPHFLSSSTVEALDMAKTPEEKFAIQAQALAVQFEQNNKDKKALPINPLTQQQMTYQQMAEVALQNNLVTFEEQNNQHTIKPNSQAILSTEQHGEHLGSSRGLVASWMALFFIPVKVTHHIVTIIPGCATCNDPNLVPVR